MIRDCLSAAGITQVVWIDDFFAAPSRDSSADAIHKHAERLKQQNTPSIDLPGFGRVDLTKPKNEIDDAIDELIENLSDQQVVGAEKALAALGGAITLDTAPQPDLTPEDFQNLRTAFGNTLRTFSLGSWTSSGAAEFASAGEDVLFLVDKEFNREPAAIDGARLLADIIGTTKAFCVMLTHTCPEAGQDDVQTGISASHKLPKQRFAVLSKQQGSGITGVEPRFARAFYTVMTHRFTAEIASTISTAIAKSAESTTAELAKQSVFDLDRALFENSNREGVQEFDVVSRIFNIQQRYAIKQTLQQPDLQKQLRAARALRQKTGNLRAQWPHAHPDMSAFRDWRKREIFEDGAGLNALHSPLACGDVFETEGDKSRYVLLAQPCDLVVRHGGSRRTEVALLVLVSEPRDTDREDSESAHRFFHVKGVFGPDGNWRVDFQNHFVVDLLVLDLTVFNPDGAVQLRRNHPDPEILLSAGWQRRLNRAKARIFTEGTPPARSLIGLGRRSNDLEATGDADLVRYPIRRIGRLETATARAILAAWATFNTRAALEHDFAYVEGDPPARAAAPGAAGTTTEPQK